MRSENDARSVPCVRSFQLLTYAFTGPYKVNGVPLRRVNQAYVIATSTKVDVSSVSIPASIDDAYFKRVASPNDGTIETAETGSGAVVSKAYLSQRKADQKTVDDALLAVISNTEMLKEYLGSRFTLSKHDKPHELKF